MNGCNVEADFYSFGKNQLNFNGSALDEQNQSTF